MSACICNEIQLGAVGIPIDVVVSTCVFGVTRKYDLTGAVVVLHFFPPTGVSFTKPGVVTDAEGGVVTYVPVLSTEFAIAGKWRVRAHVTLSPLVSFTTDGTFTVLANT